MDKRNIEQRYVIKFYVKLKENPAKTYETIKNEFGDDFLSPV